MFFFQFNKSFISMLNFILKLRKKKYRFRTRTLYIFQTHHLLENKY